MAKTACFKGVWFQHFWPLTANNLIRSWSQCWSWCSLASETKLPKPFVVGEEERKGLAADTMQTPLKLNTWKKISRGWWLENSEGKSVLRVLNNRNPCPHPFSTPIWCFPSWWPIWKTHPYDLYKQTVTIHLSFSSSKLHLAVWNWASPRVAIRRVVVKVTKHPVPRSPSGLCFQSWAHCVLWNYTRQNVLWQLIISARRRPSNGLQYFTFIKAIRGSVRLDNRHFFSSAS